MTPGELNKIKSAVAHAAADLLAREGNAEVTAEELADQLADVVLGSMMEAYEAIQAKSYNLVVLGHFRLDDDQSYVAAVGPLSTRAPQRARGVGEHFAWDYKTRRGTGKFVLVPLIRSPNEAWDDVRREGLAEFKAHLSSITSGVEPTYEAMRFEIPDARRAQILADWQMDPEILSRTRAPGCICGLSERYIQGNRGYSKHGIPTTVCPCHPEGRSS